MKICVTGGAGFIGSHVTDRLIADGHAVTVLDNLSYGKRENIHRDATFHQADIVNDDLEALFFEQRFDGVIHAAAHRTVPVSIERPSFDAEQNILGTLRVLMASRASNVSRFIFFSSGGAVYPEQPSVIPTPEQVAPMPGTPYGISKLACEHYVRWFHDSAMSTLSLRPSNVYGPRQDSGGEGGVVAIFMKRAQQGLPLRINGDGSQTRDFVSVWDVADAVLLALKDPGLSGEFNISTGRETTIQELADTANAATGRSVPIEHGPAREGDYARSCLDSTRFQRAAGWKASVSLSEGLDRMTLTA